MLGFLTMLPLGCLMHWYVSALFALPVVVVGGWGWLSSKRMVRRKVGGGPTAGGGHPKVS